MTGGTGEDAAMAQFTSYDGTKLAFRRAGTGRPLVCLPGGPGRTPDYLGDLGGLGAWRELILPDTRAPGNRRCLLIQRPTAVTGWPVTSRHCAPKWGWSGSTCSATQRAGALSCATRPPTPSGSIT
jgi:hypothetical protein